MKEPTFRMEHLKCTPFTGFLVFLSNIIPSFKGLAGTRIQAYWFVSGACQEEKSLIKLTPDARVFIPGKPFQPSLMIVGEARSLPLSGAHERWKAWKGQTL